MEKIPGEVDTVEMAKALVGLEDADMPLHGITMIAYFDEDGHPCFASRTHGTPWIQESLGLIDAIRLSLWDQYKENQEDGD